MIKCVNLPLKSTLSTTTSWLMRRIIVPGLKCLMSWRPLMPVTIVGFDMVRKKLRNGE